MEERVGERRPSFIGLPLSLTLSPFVPHGEREAMPVTSILVDIYFIAKKPMK